MTNLRALVSELGRIEEGTPVVTLYLDVHWRDEQQRERVRIFFNDEVREARQLFSERPEWTGLARTFERLRDRIDTIVNEDLRSGAHGVMFVASEDRDLFVETWLGERIDSAMYVDQAPRLFPLIELTSLQRTVFLVCVESPGAEILERQLGEVVDEQQLQRAVPKRHHEGGWSQRRFETHTRHVIQAVWKECIDLLARMDTAASADIVLFGTEENLRAFERLLPPKLAERVIGVRPLSTDRRKLLEAADEVRDDERVAREFALVHRILRQGLSDRSGSVGLDDTLLAVNESSVRTLAVTSRFNASGFKCSVCGSLWRTGASGCVFCGGRTSGVLLREALARRCLADGGGIVVVTYGGPLDAYRGIGCLLRHRLGEERPPMRPSTDRIEAQ